MESEKIECKMKSVPMAWGIKTPRGVIIAALAQKKPWIYKAAAGMFGHLTKRGTWKELYRQGWRIVPVMMWEEGGAVAAKWRVWTSERKTA